MTEIDSYNYLLELFPLTNNFMNFKYDFFSFFFLEKKWSTYQYKSAVLTIVMNVERKAIWNGVVFWVRAFKYLLGDLGGRVVLVVTALITS